MVGNLAFSLDVRAIFTICKRQMEIDSSENAQHSWKLVLYSTDVCCNIEHGFVQHNLHLFQSFISSVFVKETNIYQLATNSNI